MSHPAGSALPPPTCRVTPDCAAPAISRISTVRDSHNGRATLMAVRPITEQRIGYAACADHTHHLLDLMLLAALPAPNTEDLTR